MEEEENYNHIISKIKEAFNSPELSDILIRSKNKTFHCHKIILSSREGGWGIEKSKSLASTNILHWQDIKDNIAERILHWIYLGKRLASESDSREFLQDLMGAALTLKLTDVKTSVEDLIRNKDDVKLQVLRESKKQGMVKACNTCPGCMREDCGFCRECMDMKKHGGEGKLKKRCRLRQCSAQIQTRNLRKINQINRESSTKVHPRFMVVERKNLLVSKVIKIPSSGNIARFNPITEEDLSENEEKMDRVQELIQDVNIVGKVGGSNNHIDIGQQISGSEMNISHLPEEVSTMEEGLCSSSNAETSVRENTSKVTRSHEEANYLDNVLVSVTNAEHDYTSVSWVRYSTLYFGFNIKVYFHVKVNDRNSDTTQTCSEPDMDYQDEIWNQDSGVSSEAEENTRTRVFEQKFSLPPGVDPANVKSNISIPTLGTQYELNSLLSINTIGRKGSHVSEVSMTSGYNVTSAAEKTEHILDDRVSKYIDHDIGQDVVDGHGDYGDHDLTLETILNTTQDAPRAEQETFETPRDQLVNPQALTPELLVSPPSPAGSDREDGSIKEGCVDTKALNTNPEELVIETIENTVVEEAGHLNQLSNPYIMNEVKQKCRDVIKTTN